jgi:glycosyltransferase involved in cell wall biosynthesis
VAKSVGRAVNIREEQIEVIYNPNNIDLIINKANEPCPKWYLDVIKKPTLITVARLAYPKGLDILIKAHERVLQKGIDHNLVICGEGYLREKLEKQVENLGVGSSVYLPGYIANPFPLVKNATAFVLPSLHEAFGMVVIEALALGTPIVSTACQGPEEILANGEYGIIVKPEDISSLAEGMSQILIDSDLRRRLSEKGLERARCFSSENRTTDWEKLLLKVAK